MLLVMKQPKKQPETRSKTKISYSHRSMSFPHVGCANATELVSLKEHQTSEKNVSTLKVTIWMMVYVTAVRHWSSKADILPMPLSHKQTDTGLMISE